MIIVRLNRDAQFGEIVVRRGVDYVMADAIAMMLRQHASPAIERFDKMEDEYNKYNGEDLTDKSLVMWRTGGFGDLLFVSSLVHHLKKKYPASKINVATSQRFHDVWVGNRDIQSMTSPGVLPVPLKFLQQHDYQLKFEGTIEADTDPNQLPAVVRFAQEAGAELSTIERLPYYPGAMTHFTTARNALRKHSLNLRPMEYGCIQFKSSSIVRDWRYERMVELADKLADKYNMPILMLGNNFYHDLINETGERYKAKYEKDINPLALDLTPNNLRFLYSSALIARAKFVVTIDSALVHVAAATNTPSVSLYGPFPGKIRTVDYPRNITLEKPGSCAEFPNGCLQHTQSGEQNVLPVNTHCKENIDFCRMMDAISVDEVMAAIDEADGRWGKETWEDRHQLFKERESYVPEGAKTVVDKPKPKTTQRPKGKRLDKKSKRNRRRSGKKNR